MLAAQRLALGTFELVDSRVVTIYISKYQTIETIKPNKEREKKTDINKD
jgi:hypothetical protein